MGGGEQAQGAGRGTWAQARQGVGRAGLHVVDFRKAGGLQVVEVVVDAERSLARRAELRGAIAAALA